MKKKKTFNIMYVILTRLISHPIPFFFRTLFIIFMFCFGALITNLLTDIGKVTVGALRPYFLTVCKPNTTLPHCSQGFVTDNICTGDPKDILEARFVSISISDSVHYIS